VEQFTLTQKLIIINMYKNRNCS